MKDDNYRPKNSESAPTAFGDSRAMPMTNKSVKVGYNLGKSLPDCDEGCLAPDSGYMGKGKMRRSDVSSDDPDFA